MARVLPAGAFPGLSESIRGGGDLYDQHDDVESFRREGYFLDAHKLFESEVSYKSIININYVSSDPAYSSIPGQSLVC